MAKMPSGSSTPEVARADRIREKAAQKRRGTRNAIAALRTAPGSQPYREEMDSVSEVTAGPQGISARGIPREAWKWIGVGIALSIVLIAASLVILAWRGMR